MTKEEKVPQERTYIEAPKEVVELAKSLYDSMEWEVEPPRIKYLMNMKNRSSFLGKCSKASGKWKYLTDYDYVIELWGVYWEIASKHNREALLSHELRHVTYSIKKDGSTVWKIRKHDVEEFLSVVEKYGIWSPELEALATIFLTKSEVK